MWVVSQQKKIKTFTYTNVWVNGRAGFPTLRNISYHHFATLHTKIQGIRLEQ